MAFTTALLVINAKYCRINGLQYMFDPGNRWHRTPRNGEIATLPKRALYVLRQQIRWHRIGNNQHLCLWHRMWQIVLTIIVEKIRMHRWMKRAWHGHFGYPGIIMLARKYMEEY